MSVTLRILVVCIMTSLAFADEVPRITLRPKNQKVGEDMIVSFFCKATGDPQPTFKWFRNKRLLNPNRSRYDIYDMPNGSVLRIEPVKYKFDNTVFTCMVDNGIGTPDTANARLHVYQTNERNDLPSGYPEITENPVLRAVEKGRNTRMRCQARAEGFPPEDQPTITWLKDRIPLDMTNERLTLDNGNLFIERSVESDAGRYECVAENSIGVTYSYAAMLYVRVRRVPPRFTVTLVDVEIDPNSNINISCIAVGSPMPVVQWRVGVRDIGEQQVGRNTLQLINVTESMNYTCVASSALGSINETIQVIVRVPSAPRNLIVELLNEDPPQAYLTWQRPQETHGPLGGYKVIWSVTGDVYISVVLAPNRQSFMTDILERGSRYEFHVLARNAAGYGERAVVFLETPDRSTLY